MPRMIDQLRASKLPSNMMQFAARGALQVSPAENIEILVHLARHNKVFGDLARMTLAGWDEKASVAAAGDPQTPREVLEYLIAPDNLRPKLLPALLNNPSVPESLIVKLATSAMRDTIDVMLKSERATAIPAVLNTLRSNPYTKKGEIEELLGKMQGGDAAAAPGPPAQALPQTSAAVQPVTADATVAAAPVANPAVSDPGSHDPQHEEAVATYMKDHAADIVAEGEKPFQAIGGIVELLGQDYFPVVQKAEIASPEASATAHAVTSTAAASTSGAASSAAAKPAVVKAHGHPNELPKRENTLQKINRLDVKGRIQLALKGNKEERSILIRDGTKVVALAVLEAPKLADGEVEKFASQKNVLEAVLRQIPLKRRFMKNYIVVRNLCANPRTPLDLALGLMKNLLIQDLKNISANKEVSETIRKLALKMYKQKLDEANKK